jgi:hypothetical protein
LPELEVRSVQEPAQIPVLLGCMRFHIEARQRMRELLAMS